MVYWPNENRRALSSKDSAQRRLLNAVRHTCDLSLSLFCSLYLSLSRLAPWVALNSIARHSPGIARFIFFNERFCWWTSQGLSSASQAPPCQPKHRTLISLISCFHSIKLTTLHDGRNWQRYWLEYGLKCQIFFRPDCSITSGLLADAAEFISYYKLISFISF